MEFFLCFLDCLNLMIFLKLMTHSWRSLWRSSGKAWHGYGKTVARLWSSNGKVLEKNHGRVYGKGMAKLWQGGGDICSQVNQSFGHVMARIWPCYGKNMAKKKRWSLNSVLATRVSGTGSSTAQTAGSHAWPKQPLSRRWQGLHPDKPK